MGHMLDSKDTSAQSLLADFCPACFHHGTKILIGSAGGSGSDVHVDGLTEIIKDISTKRGYSFKVSLFMWCWAKVDRYDQIRH